MRFCSVILLRKKLYDYSRYRNKYGVGFYRVMHFSAKRGIAIACRPSVCLSVCL